MGFMNKLRVALSLGALGLVAAAAVPMAVHAGYVANQNVWHYNIIGNKGTTGIVRTARYSGDTRQNIGCTTYKNSNGVMGGSCIGGDSNALYNSCHTTDPQMIYVMQSIGSTSYITFEYDANGACTSVSVNNNSFAL
jgi:predicted secreted Zn-dependent protease